MTVEELITELRRFDPRRRVIFLERHEKHFKGIDISDLFAGKAFTIGDDLKRCVGPGDSRIVSVGHPLSKVGDEDVVVLNDPDTGIGEKKAG